MFLVPAEAEQLTCPLSKERVTSPRTLEPKQHSRACWSIDDDSPIFYNFVMAISCNARGPTITVGERDH